MTITQTVAVAGNLRNAEPYMCSCGDTFGGLALLETHLDLLGDDSDTRTCARTTRTPKTAAASA